MNYKQALADLLADVLMPAITRHWVDEYLGQLSSLSPDREQDLLDEIGDLEMEKRELEREVWSLEGQLDDLQIELDGLRQEDDA